METATRFADQSVTISPTTPESAPARTLTVTATFVLSEEGRKAALLEGRDGRAVQTATLQVPSSRLHLVSVDRQGVARLRLRPRFELDADDRVQRIDESPVYDVPPTADELFRAAARNHELEAAFHASRASAADRRLESERSDRQRAAEAFMTDLTERAVPHPPPTPRACVLVTPHGRFRFDVRADVGLAKDVPAEAHRRFRADQRARQEKNRADRAAQLALHEEKRRFIAEWIADYGTDEQRARHAAGLLPMAEAIDAIADQAFAALGPLPRYVHDGAERLLTALSPTVRAAVGVVEPRELRIVSDDAETATAEQFGLLRRVQSTLPATRPVLRRHRITLHRPGGGAWSVVAFGVLVTRPCGPLLLRREFAAPGAANSLGLSPNRHD